MKFLHTNWPRLNSLSNAIIINSFLSSLPIYLFSLFLWKSFTTLIHFHSWLLIALYFINSRTWIYHSCFLLLFDLKIPSSHSPKLHPFNLLLHLLIIPVNIHPFSLNFIPFLPPQLFPHLHHTFHLGINLLIIPFYHQFFLFIHMFIPSQLT